MSPELVLSAVQEINPADGIHVGTGQPRAEQHFLKTEDVWTNEAFLCRFGNPYIGIAHKALSNCNRPWPELGLTPTSRTRLTTTPLTPGADPFAEFDPPSIQKPQ